VSGRGCFAGRGKDRQKGDNKQEARVNFFHRGDYSSKEQASVFLLKLNVKITIFYS
jgi:hypothetical protein